MCSLETCVSLEYLFVSACLVFLQLCDGNVKIVPCLVKTGMLSESQLMISALHYFSMVLHLLWSFYVSYFCYFCLPFQVSLINPTEHEFEVLLEQLRERLNENHSECIYNLGSGCICKTCGKVICHQKIEL